MNVYKIIDTMLSKLINEGKEKFVIYPFGEYGIKVKEILNWQYGITEVLIVDKKLSQLNSNITSVDNLKNSSDYTWILTSDNVKTRRELYSSIQGIVAEEQIADPFKSIRLYSDKFKLLSKIGNENDTRIPSIEFIELVRKKKLEKRKITIAEVGVGYGTTSVEACKLLDSNDTYECYDFKEVVTDLVGDLKRVSDINCQLIAKGNTHKEFDSYAWALSKTLMEMRNNNLNGVYDVVYLDGFHSFFHDGLACCLIKELLKSDGYIIFDDMKWTFEKSRTMNPKISPRTLELFTKEQIEDSQIQRVVNMFMINDKDFEFVGFFGAVNGKRAVYRKL